VLARNADSTTEAFTLASTVETRRIYLLVWESAACTIGLSTLLQLAASHQESGCLPELVTVVATLRRYQIR